MRTVYFFLFSLLGTVIATFLGSILGAFSKKLPIKLTRILQNFAVGSIIALIFFELFHHSVEGFSEVTSSPVLMYVYAYIIIFGVGIIFFILHEVLHHFTHHHEDSENDQESCEDHGHTHEIFSSNKSSLIASLIFLGAIAIHNIPEGFSIGILFTTVSETEVPLNGIILSLVMFIHNFIIGFTMAQSFINSEKKPGFAMILTTLTGFLSFILSICGYYLNYSMGELASSIIVSISTGSLLYILFIELLPESFYKYKSKFTFIYIIFGLLVTGILLII